MEFNLKRILRALLLSTSEPLSIKDIQEVVTGYHAEVETATALAEAAGAPAPGPVVIAAPLAEAEPDAPAAGQAVLQDLMDQVPSLLTATQIRDAMEAIAQDLEISGDVCRLVQGPNGFRLAVAPEYADWVRLLRDSPRPLRLSQAALETLAIVAYRQPVTRAEIEAVRGVAADSALNRLLELELACISGRADLPGRPIQYSTTDKFLEFCGIRSLEELPATDVVSPSQLNEWIRRATLPEEQQELLSDTDVGLPPSESAEAPASALPASPAAVSS
jgi:segregation and condensation protein B